MRELSSRGMIALSTMIQGANDPVFINTGLQRITLRILVCLLSRLEVASALVNSNFDFAVAWL